MQIINQVFRDPSEKDVETYRVFFCGKLCSPRWHQRGPAQAYLQMLERGERKPEYEAMRSSSESDSAQNKEASHARNHRVKRSDKP